jgi:hypothetical protein
MFATTAITPTVQRDQLTPTRPGHDNATEARLPGSRYRNDTPKTNGSCKITAATQYIAPIACTTPKINQYLRFALGPKMSHYLRPCLFDTLPQFEDACCFR